MKIGVGEKQCHALSQALLCGGGCTGAGGSSGSSSVAGSAAESLPTAPSLSLGAMSGHDNTRAPSAYQTAETSAAVHLWPLLVRFRP